MKKSKLWKIWLVLGVAVLWFWQANQTIDDSHQILVRGNLGTIATNVLEARGQEFELRGDFVYIDTSDRQETLDNLSAALTSVEFARNSTGGYMMFDSFSGSEDRFPVYGSNWEPVGYYKNDNIYFEYDPGSHQAIPAGAKKGYVRKTRLDQETETVLRNQINHDYQALYEAMKKLDERVIAGNCTVDQDYPCLGEVSWDTERPIQRL